MWSGWVQGWSHGAGEVWQEDPGARWQQCHFGGPGCGPGDGGEVCLVCLRGDCRSEVYHHQEIGQ